MNVVIAATLPQFPRWHPQSVTQHVPHAVWRAIPPAAVSLKGTQDFQGGFSAGLEEVLSAKREAAGSSGRAPTGWGRRLAAGPQPPPPWAGRAPEEPRRPRLAPGAPHGSRRGRRPSAHRRRWVPPGSLPPVAAAPPRPCGLRPPGSPGTRGTRTCRSCCSGSPRRGRARRAPPAAPAPPAPRRRAAPPRAAARSPAPSRWGAERPRPAAAGTGTAGRDRAGRDGAGATTWPPTAAGEVRPPCWGGRRSARRLPAMLGRAETRPPWRGGQGALRGLLAQHLREGRRGEKYAFSTFTALGTSTFSRHLKWIKFTRFSNSICTIFICKNNHLNASQ